MGGGGGIIGGSGAVGTSPPLSPSGLGGGNSGGGGGSPIYSGGSLLPVHQAVHGAAGSGGGSSGHRGRSTPGGCRLLWVLGAALFVAWVRRMSGSLSQRLKYHLAAGVVLASCLMVVLCVVTWDIGFAEPGSRCDATKRPDGKFPWVVFSSVGPDHKGRLWLNEPHAALFDVMLVQYSNPAVPVPQPFGVTDLFKHKGSKLENLDWVLQTKPLALEPYDYIFAVDDDIEITTKDLNTLFSIACEQQLDLAAPTYAPGSQISWPLTAHRWWSTLRWTNFVEIGIAVMSKRAMKACQPAFTMSRTTFGVDFVCAKVMQPCERCLAVIDQVTCIHPARVSTLDKILPRSQHGADAAAMLARYDLNDTNPWFPVKPQYVPRVTGALVPWTTAALMVGLVLVANFLLQELTWWMLKMVAPWSTRKRIH